MCTVRFDSIWFVRTMCLLLMATACLSCVSEYEQKGIDTYGGILVVEGMITDDVTRITLSLSWPLYQKEDDAEMARFPDPAVTQLYVETESGQRFPSSYTYGEGSADPGYYLVENGKLEVNQRYRLYIESAGNTYATEYLLPISTPPIDEIKIVQRAVEDPVLITVTTHDPADKSPYYRWSYKEAWEFKTELKANYGTLNGVTGDFSLLTSFNKYYCWGEDESKSMILGRTDKFSENIVKEKTLVEIRAADEKLSIMYYVAVTQNQIRKEAYTYFENIQKNIEQTGGIFSSIPSEMKGNIQCLTQPDIPVIGYVDVSVTQTMEQYLPEVVQFYQPPVSNCNKQFTEDGLTPGIEIYSYVQGPPPKIVYAPRYCVDCTMRGTKNRPANWPTSHL